MMAGRPAAVAKGDDDREDLQAPEASSDAVSAATARLGRTRGVAGPVPFGCRHRKCSTTAGSRSRAFAGPDGARAIALASSRARNLHVRRNRQKICKCKTLNELLHSSRRTFGETYPHMLATARAPGSARQLHALDNQRGR